MSANFRRHDRKINGPKLTRLIPIAAILSNGTASGFARAFNGRVIRDRSTVRVPASPGPIG